jgi:hypothetical protein
MAADANYPVTPPAVALYRRISWPAVFAGALVALGVELLFIAFGLFIGFNLTTPGGIQAWSEAWFFVTMLASLLAGGWVAARLSTNTTGPGWLHGFVTWGLTMVATFAFALWASYSALGTTIAAVRTTVMAAESGASASAGIQGEASRVRAEAAGIATPSESQAAQVARNAAGVASTISLVVFGGILLAAIASILGGAAAGRGVTHAPVAT